ncbi:MAG: methionyl-tRNA formyltransferase [Campylobacterales bacterium]|nr:methionyl-tRNA formyltransferase [Campylobacterales bacterium]
MKRVVFMGTPHYAKVILEYLIKDQEFEISLIITQPDRPVGRKQELLPSAVKTLALEYGLVIMQPQNLKETGIKEAIENIKPDFIVVAAFGQILPREILNIAPCINLHASLLPLYRGASPIQQVLLNQDRFTGITAMLMEEGLDSGPMLGFRYFEIPEDMVVGDLDGRLSICAAKLTLDILRDFEHIKPITQTAAAATHCKKIKKSDGEVCFDDAGKLYAKFRAFYGWPGVFLKSGLKLLELDIVDLSKHNTQGEILAVHDTSIMVGCVKGAVELKVLQPSSKKAMSAKAYCIGRGLTVGDTFI